MSYAREQEKIIGRLADEAVQKLREHCDTVTIIVTAPSLVYPGCTGSRKFGDGNYYAQYGACKAWVSEQERSFQRDSDEKARPVDDE